MGVFCSRAGASLAGKRAQSASNSPMAPAPLMGSLHLKLMACRCPSCQRCRLFTAHGRTAPAHPISPART